MKLNFLYICLFSELYLCCRPSSNMSLEKNNRSEKKHGYGIGCDKKCI